MSDPHLPDDYYDKGEAENWNPINDGDILELALTATDEHLQYMHRIDQSLQKIASTLTYLHSDLSVYLMEQK